jgi:hypothetical protein
MYKRLKAFVRRLIRTAGYNFYRVSDEDRLFIEKYEQRLSGESVASIFGPALPRLSELRARYAEVNLPIAVHSIWSRKDVSDNGVDIGYGGFDLRTFRGHNAYVWSYAHSNPVFARLQYFVYADSVRRKDDMRLLDKLKEDGAFGCLAFEYPGIASVSRDLLDSVVELNFLHKHLKVLARDDVRVLDIGAGYGRLACRMLEAHPSTKSYTCVDAVPESTFLSEFYVKYRGLEGRVNVVPMHELEEKLVPGGYDIALNIHSFSECTYEAIEWWLRRIRRLNIRYLMIVPNEHLSFLSVEPDRSRRDYSPLLQELGYEQIACEPLFDDPAVQELLRSKDHMFLFEFRQAGRAS